MFKLSSLTFIVVGVLLMATIFAYFWFMRINPANIEAGYYEEQNRQLQEIISDASKKAATERVRQALTKVRDAEMNWKATVQKRTPSSGQMNLVPNRWQLTVNARRWHAVVERDLNSWFSKTGVRLVEPALLQVPFPTDLPNDLVRFYFNYPAFPFPIAIWDLGTVTVEGSYDAIMNHVRSWSRIPNYIVSVRGLSVTGTGNRLRATYGLTAVVYINTENVSGGPGPDQGVPDLSGGEQTTGQTGSGTMQRPGGGPATGGGGGTGRGGLQG